MFRKFAVMMSALIALTACDTSLLQALLPIPTEAPPQAGVLIPKIISTRPHDTGAFTQGLLLYEGRLFESTGLNGQSSLREVDPQTGEVLRKVDLPPEYFAEGLALVGDRLIQLTWQNGVAFVYQLETFEQVRTFSYDTEGWGLCYDGADLYMSDGSSLLYVRDPQTFEVKETVQVLYEGQPVTQLNELECVEDSVFANIWLTDMIVQIDKETGRIQNIINAEGLLTPEEQAQLGSGATLNGIAFDESTGHFLITGKLFPKLWEVTLVGTRSR
jgi:glutaminyl-peptide cyclotransferase